MIDPKHKLPEVVRVLLTTALVTAAVVGFGEYLFWTKPLQDDLKASSKEVNALKEQVDILVNESNVAVKTYTNADLNFSFDYKDSYEVITNFSPETAPTGTFASVIKKGDTTKASLVWLSSQKTSDALLVDTKFPEKVVKSDTNVGKNDTKATSLVFLPGRGTEFAASLHVVKIFVPLKKLSDTSLVLTNVGDADIANFQFILNSLHIY